MASQALVMENAKNKIDQFVINNENLNAYDRAEEAERIRLDEIDFAVDEGRREGRKEGRKERDVQYIANLLKKKFSVTEIADISGLSKTRVEEIIATIQ